MNQELKFKIIEIIDKYITYKWDYKMEEELLSLFEAERDEMVKEIEGLKCARDEQMSFRLGFNEALDKVLELIKPE